MEIILLNIVWPAIYVSTGLYTLWYTVFITIFIEGLVLYFFLKLSFGKSLLIATVGNFISGVLGIFVMPLAMLPWHVIADNFVSSFGTINWIATFILMFIGSFLIEVLVIMLIWKLEFRKLFLPLMIGNFLTYVLVAILIYSGIISMS